MRLWNCPNGCGGVRAPERMRKDDVRRYCLDCSAQTGRLVERSSPALERKRSASKAKSQARSTAKRERARSQWIVTLKDANGNEHDLNVRTELRRALSEMGYFDGWAYGHRPTIDELEITIHRGHKHYHTGHAWGNFKVTFTFGNQDGYEAGLEVIYHEAAHLASPYDERHGARFHRLLAETLQKRWPFITYGSIRPGQSGNCWEKGERVRQQMREHVRTGGAL